MSVRFDGFRTGRGTCPVLVAAVPALTAAIWGCQRNDLGRYCVLGQRVESAPSINRNDGQPLMTALNLQAPECLDRICMLQGPYKLHPVHVQDPSAPCEDGWCRPPYGCDGSLGLCVYWAKAVCTRECRKHADCEPGPTDANGQVCTGYVCRRQPLGDAFEGHCICLCKDFMIDPCDLRPWDPWCAEPPDEPSGCR